MTDSEAIDQEQCENCYFWMGRPHDLQATITVSFACRRYPQRVDKVWHDWCGEWKAHQK